jgi:polyhydroxyalkanoate synthesis regulator phasin
LTTLKRKGPTILKNLRKKNETVIQNKMQGHSSRIEQTEDRISELEDEMVN